MTPARDVRRAVGLLSGRHWALLGVYALLLGGVLTLGVFGVQPTPAGAPPVAAPPAPADPVVSRPTIVRIRHAEQPPRRPAVRPGGPAAGPEIPGPSDGSGPGGPARTPEEPGPEPPPPDPQPDQKPDRKPPPQEPQQDDPLVAVCVPVACVHADTPLLDNQEGLAWLTPTTNANSSPER